MLPGEQVPPDVEDSAPLSDWPDGRDAFVQRRARRFGFVLMVVSAIVSFALLYAAWVGLKAAWHIARR